MKAEVRVFVGGTRSRMTGVVEGDWCVVQVPAAKMDIDFMEADLFQFRVQGLVHPEMVFSLEDVEVLRRMAEAMGNDYIVLEYDNEAEGDDESSIEFRYVIEDLEYVDQMVKEMRLRTGTEGGNQIEVYRGEDLVWSGEYEDAEADYSEQMAVTFDVDLNGDHSDVRQFNLNMEGFVYNYVKGLWKSRWEYEFGTDIRKAMLYDCLEIEFRGEECITRILEDYLENHEEDEWQVDNDSEEDAMRLLCDFVLSVDRCEDTPESYIGEHKELVGPLNEGTVEMFYAMCVRLGLMARK